jgi:membrane protein
MVEAVIRAVKFVLRAAEATSFYARSIWRKLGEDDVLFLASGLAFNGILVLIPMLFLSAAAVGVIAPPETMGMNQVNDILEAIFPQQPFASQIKEGMRSLIVDIINHRQSVGLIGVVVLIWTTMSLFDALRSALNRVYELKRVRTLLGSLAHEFGFVVIAFLLFLATNFSIWVYSIAAPWVLSLPAIAPHAGSAVLHTVPTIIILLLTAVMFYITYRHITDVRPPRAAAVISTLTTTVLWVIAGRVFAFYLSDWSSIGKIYGPYAFLLVMLVWIYYSSLLFVFGGIVGHVHWQRKMGKG